MRHNLKLTTKERIDAWLDLCEFTFNLMKKILSKEEFEARIKKMRKEHLKRDKILLNHFGKLRNEKK